MSVRSLAPLVLLAAIQLVWLPGARSQPGPVGPQFQVNTYTTYLQKYPAVASNSAGAFVVVWPSLGSAGSDVDGYSIHGQRYDSAGTPQGGEFQVNTYTTATQNFPAVAVDGSGNFVVVWVSFGSVGSDADVSVQGQRYDSTGTPQGSQFQVNTFTTSFQGSPAVAADSAGTFVVVWDSYGSAGSDTDSLSIHGQRYDSTGTPQGGEFQVNTYTTRFQRSPAVASDGAGNFVVVWQSYGSAGSDTDSVSIQGQRYDSTGTPQGMEFQVNTYTTGFARFSAVAIDGAGNFVVVWSSLGSAGSDTDGESIQGQRYDSTGTPQGGEFQVNTYTTSSQYDPAVSADGTGGFIVVWGSPESAGCDLGYSIQGQRYDGAGTPQGGEFQVNTYLTLSQLQGVVAADGVGNFVVAWTSESGAGSDTSNGSIQGQRFVPMAVSTPPVDHRLEGRSTAIRPGTLAKFVGKPIAGDAFPPPAANPVVTGGSLRIFDTATTAGDDTYNLHAGAAWRGLSNPAGSTGFKYTGAGTLSDPCRVVLLREGVVKGVCRGAGITLAPPFSGAVGIVLSLGTTDRYDARFGGDVVRNDAMLTKRRRAPAMCP